ncbi:MAG TPA: DUF6265 family protein, partial [Gemmatimonas sp.]|nr:DUF6265 family protein [Gemmatimonas sp.]
MSGCWQRNTPTSTVEEQWMVPRGGTLMGMSRTAAGDREREYEFLRVFVMRDSLVYGSTPSGQAYAEFRAASSANR